MKSRFKSTANILSLLGILLLIGGMFFWFGKYVNLSRYHQMSKSWADQVYEQTYDSGYEHGSIDPTETLKVNLEVTPAEIRYDMYVAKHVEKNYIPPILIPISIALGIIFLVSGSYLSGKSSATDKLSSNESVPD